MSPRGTRPGAKVKILVFIDIPREFQLSFVSMLWNPPLIVNRPDLGGFAMRAVPLVGMASPVTPGARGGGWGGLERGCGGPGRDRTCPLSPSALSGWHGRPVTAEAHGGGWGGLRQGSYWPPVPGPASFTPEAYHGGPERGRWGLGRDRTRFSITNKKMEELLLSKLIEENAFLC